jgi:two-component system chemotaxis sensor kinase CheA
MSDYDDGFLKELLAMFKIEAEEHIKSMSNGLQELEQSPVTQERTNIIETIYREAHSLKGAARAVNLSSVETLCQSLESIFALIKRQEMNLNKELFSILYRAVDMLSDVLDSSKDVDISDMMHQLSRLEDVSSNDKSVANNTISEKPKEQSFSPPQTESEAKSESKPEPELESKSESMKETPEPVKQPQPFDPEPSNVSVDMDKLTFSETVRISTTRLDSLLMQIEEMLSAKLSTGQFVTDLKDIMLVFEAWKKEWERRETEVSAIRLALENKIANEGRIKISSYLDQVWEFIEWNHTQMKQVEGKMSPLIKHADNNARLMGGMVDNLLDDIKLTLMLPFSTLLKIIPKIVRDLSRDQKKEVDLITHGSTIEVDRRILEEMKDPLIHLLRNCIDHGIEKPDVRKKQKKPAGGTISITISQHSGSKIEIIISDDGGGIDPEKVKNVAIKRGVITQEKAAKASEQEILMLIFQSEISTSPIITDISGRGLGLAIVREKVEKLGGSITLHTKIGKGTTFRIVLPVTLSTFRGILVEASGQQYVIPTANVERVTRINPDIIKTVENKETIVLDGQAVSFVRLSDVLELPRSDDEESDVLSLQIIVINSSDERIAFYVDQVLKEQEVLVKSLGKQLIRVRNVAGASILGTGKVVTILNVSDLVKSAVKVTVASAINKKKEEGKLLQKSILIAEDSITSRTLLKNILTTAGYRVKTTVDGMDAYTALRSEDFDLVVSDVEMPRMNGFDLVSKIRNSKKIGEMPVILVTGLESREDRERGIDVGANAYIVKRSFDQSNLLEVVKKLI